MPAMSFSAETFALRPMAVNRLLSTRTDFQTTALPTLNAIHSLSPDAASVFPQLLAVLIWIAR